MVLSVIKLGKSSPLGRTFSPFYRLAGGRTSASWRSIRGRVNSAPSICVSIACIIYSPDLLRQLADGSPSLLQAKTGLKNIFFLNLIALRSSSMEQFEIGHGQEPIFLFKTFGEIRSTGKARIESYLGDVIMPFPHQVLCFMQPEIL